MKTPYPAEHQEELLRYATPTQAKKLLVYFKLGSSRKAVKELGCARQSLDEVIRRVKRKAAAKGFAPEYDMTKQAPEGFTVKGTSTLYDDQGNVKIQWVKTNQERETLLEQLNTITQVFCAEVAGKSKVIPAPKISNKDICCVLPIADLHFGMYSWQAETGADYDCDIAKQIMLSAITRIIESAPPAETCIIASLGDWFHADTSENKTLRSENVLDVDTRWQRVFKAGVELKKHCIELAAAKFKKVKVVICKGNHDDHTSYALSLILAAYFQNNPRIEIDDSVAEFRYHKFGNNLLGMNHGVIKMDSLPGIMACDRAQDWGTTKHRFWLIGHKHKSEMQEYPGCVVERFRTLAAKDAWTVNSGYRSNRELQRLDLHKEFGLVERSIVGINQISS